MKKKRRKITKKEIQCNRVSREKIMQRYYKCLEKLETKEIWAVQKKEFQVPTKELEFKEDSKRQGNGPGKANMV